MHVNKTKKIAILGVFAALSTVFTVLGTVISVNTVFFTALAAYLLGIIVVRFGIKEGILFYFVCAALDFFVNPDKMHVILSCTCCLHTFIRRDFFTDAKKESERMGSLCNKAYDIPFNICSDDILFSQTFIWRCDAENDRFLPTVNSCRCDRMVCL